MCIIHTVTNSTTPAGRPGRPGRRVLPIAALLASVTLLAAAGAALDPAQLLAQDSATAALPAAPEDPRTVGQREQRRFENFRRANLPSYDGKIPGMRDCQERVGMMCYWYDEESPAPAMEKPSVTAARERLITVLDSLGKLHPSDNWIAGQRVRYLNEAGRHAESLKAAEECTAWGWWCDALKGFALHAAGKYADSETAYGRVLEAMGTRERCHWRDLTPYLDDDTRREYLRTACGQPARDAFEERTWWLARTRYAMAGNDSRTEHWSRLTYVEMLREAPTIFRSAFDDAELETLVRFGWPIAWARGPDHRVMGGDGADRVNVISSEATPAYRFIPPYGVLANPAMSDSTQWAVQLPPVVARYHPPYAKKMLMLEHQQALFRRGDTALVVLAYDVSKVAAVRGAPLEAALVLTTGAPGKPMVPQRTVLQDAPPKGVLTVRAPWGPLLMSAEIAAASTSTLARARYGIQPPFAVGTRVVISDLLFYTPYGEFPTTVEEVLPHALSTQKVRADQPLGVYWESYNTNPAGEAMTVSLVVVPETEESTGLLRRGARALRLAKDATPVSVSVEDMSARGSRTSPRAVQLDISTLKRGEYLVQLEITVAGQYTIRADRRIEVVEP